MCPRHNFYDWALQHFSLTCSISFLDIDESFYSIIKNCPSQYTDILNAFDSYFDYDIRISLTSDQDSIVLDNSLLKKVYHPRFGPCFTLDAIHWNRYLFLFFNSKRFQQIFPITY